jgi:N-acetylneuraminic acid mutarotase
MKHKSFRLLLVISILGLKLLAQPITSYRWIPIEAQGDVVGRHENGFVEYKNKLYLIGGRSNPPVNVFDPKTNKWETKGKAPIDIHHFQAVKYGNAIYIVGGMHGGYPTEKPHENIWIYYPETDKWVKGAEIPEARRRGCGGVAVYNDKIYFACGIKFGHTSGTNNYFDSYDLKTGKWEILTDAPHIRDHVHAIVANDKLYLIGGRNSSFHYKDNFAAFFAATVPYVDYYDFKESKWVTLKEQLPVATGAGAVAQIDNYLIYMGGEGSKPQAYSETQCFDLDTEKWTQLATMNIGRHGSAAAVINNEIYTAAGSGNKGGGNLTSIAKFTPSHGFSKLFNGENLDGWHVKATEADRKKNFWRVHDGAIYCNSLGSKDHEYVWLMSDNEYSDFELRLKFKVAKDHKGNTGIQFRSRYDDKAVVLNKAVGWLDGPQVDIDPNNPWRNGLIYDETRTQMRWIYPSLTNWDIKREDATHKPVVFYKEDEYGGWNELIIVCKGTTVKTYVNNFLVTDFDGSGLLDSEGHKKHNVGMKGQFALQLHQFNQNHIWFKDIEVRELK